MYLWIDSEEEKKIIGKMKETMYEDGSPYWTLWRCCYICFFRLQDWTLSDNELGTDGMKWNSVESVEKSKLNDDSRLKYPVCCDIKSEIALTMMFFFVYLTLQQKKEERGIIRDRNK